jgi:hypothetical protein
MNTEQGIQTELAMSWTKEFKLFEPLWLWTKMYLDEMGDMPLFATVVPRIAVIRWGTRRTFLTPAAY